MLKGFVYKVFAAIYQKGEHMDHFVARFRRGDRYYHYDGIRNMAVASARCSEITDSADDPFPTQLPALPGGIGPIRMLGFVYKRM